MLNNCNKRSETAPIFGERRNHLKAIWDILFDNQQKEWIGFKPELGKYVYPCYACRHMFSSLTSLQDHVNRRVIVLKYNCTYCTNISTFYNRCTLLLHARSHFTIDSGQVNLSKITTFTLPLNLTGFLPLPEVPAVFKDADDTDVINDNRFRNIQFYVPNMADRGNEIVDLKPINFVYENLALKQICNTIPKCQFITAEEQTRLRESQLQIKHELFDYIDKITIPVISKVESLHNASLSCSECGLTSDGSMMKHYQGANKPTDPNLTCLNCQFIAPTLCSFKAHVRLHDEDSPYICPDCGKDFQHFGQLKKHLDEVCFHLYKLVKFRCPGKRCGKLFALGANLLKHFKHHVKCVYACNSCKLNFSDDKSMNEHTNHHEGNCNFTTIYQCNTCTFMPGGFLESEYENHLKHHSGGNTSVYVYTCKKCRSNFRSTTTFAAHLIKCVNAKSKKKDGGVNNKDPNTTKVVISKKYFCILCNEQILIENKLAHLKMCKYSRPVVLVTPIVSSKRTSPKTEDSSRKKKKRYLRPRRAEKSSDPIAENPKEFDGTYYCKLCEFKHTQREEFHAHVKVHRSISTAYQCMECGECFVVKPSLYKHLVHFHNISDVESYLDENDCFDIEAVKELESNMRLAPGESRSPVKKNQCRVCFRQFEDGSSLSTHYRIHGMAFILKNVK